MRSAVQRHVDQAGQAHGTGDRCLSTAAGTAFGVALMRHDHRLCEDEDDATRMAETILRELGYTDVQSGKNALDVKLQLSPDTFKKIARNAERIAKWARTQARGRR